MRHFAVGLVGLDHTSDEFQHPRTAAVTQSARTELLNQNEFVPRHIIGQHRYGITSLE
jgi:hypothetical protein